MARRRYGKLKLPKFMNNPAITRSKAEKATEEYRKQRRDEFTAMMRRLRLKSHYSQCKYCRKRYGA